MTAFAIITGIVTLLGFLIQLSDVFPTHRESRKTLVVLVTGIFVGSVVGAVSGVELKVERLNTPVEIAVVILLILVFLFFILEGLRALLAKQEAERRSALERTGTAFGALIICLIIGALTFHSGPSESLTVDEVLTLATKHRQSGDFDRAISLVERTRRTLSKNDPRNSTLEMLMNELILEQSRSGLQ